MLELIVGLAAGGAIGATLAAVVLRTTGRRSAAPRPASELEQENADLRKAAAVQENVMTEAAQEILSPLTVVIASLEAASIADEQLPADVVPTIDRAHRASVRIKKLVENVLLTAGSGHPIDCDHEPFDVDRELRAAFRSIERSDKVVYLRSRVPLFAVGDADRFRMLVEQLLADADRSAPPRSVIRVVGYEEDGRAHVTITDEGPSIPPEQRDAAFRRFREVGAEPLPRSKGPSLYLARRLAVAMGGQLEIDDVESGARLHVTLPAAAADASDHTPPTKTVEGMLFVPVEPPAHTPRNRGAA